MRIINDPAGMQEFVWSLPEKLSRGLVPTMGALHEGHLSLVERARQENGLAIASIFVNPTQFGPAEDYQSYPRDIDADKEKLDHAKLDVLFLPEVAAMYPEGFGTSITVEKVTSGLCGPFRPGHFRGVATVVAKLFNIVTPTRAYFGQKDYQQTVVIRKMVRDMAMNVEVVVCPTLREPDGLAMSSRNVYLSPQERAQAPLIQNSMLHVAKALQEGRLALKDVPAALREILEQATLVKEIQYASVYDPDSLEEITCCHNREYAQRSVVLALALRLGTTRLIDNMVVDL